MGLPMFREPDEAIAEDAAAKLDRAAANRRSTIRREPTVRPGRYQASIIRERLREGRREHILERVRAQVQEHEQQANQQIAELEAELERLRSIRMRHRAGDRERSHIDRSEDASFRVESGQPPSSRVDDTSTRETINSHLPRPPRESSLRFEVGASRSTSPRPIRHSIPSPPWSSGSDGLRRSVPDGPLSAQNDSPALTPGFAPARGPYRADEGPSDGDLPSLETPPPEETYTASYPPLRRVSHLSPRPTGGPRVDGLGDRRRSPTPDSHEEETWTNLLANMDNGGSSTATSFASDTADSVTRSNRSTQNTATSFGEISQTDDSCDLDLPHGITEDDVREIRAQHRRMQRREPDGPLMTGERGLREHRERQTRRVELSMFQNILEHLQRREDIPDEWWAAVGLSPDVVRGG